VYLNGAPVARVDAAAGEARSTESCGATLHHSTAVTHRGGQPIRRIKVMEVSFRMHGGVTSLQSYLEGVRARFLAVHVAAATYLRMSAPDLRERLAGGDSLGDLAQFEGKSLDGLRRTVVEALRAAPAGDHGAELDPSWKSSRRT